MPDAGETQIVRRMGRQVYVETRSGEPTGEETSIVPANGTGVHVNGAAAAPDPALKRREAALKERIRQLKEEIEAHKDDWVSKNFLRRESLANAESMLADLQSGKSRGFFTQLNDGVVALTDSVVDGGEAAIDGGVKLGSEAWGLGGEVVTGDFGAAGDRLGRGADAVKGAASDGYNAVVNEPWFQGTRDAWNSGQYGAATGGVVPEVAGAAAIIKGGAKKLLRAADDAETPPTPHNNAIKEEKPDEKPGDKQDPEKKGEPVLVTSGEYVETWDDFSLDGTIPITLSRSYGALWKIQGPFGRNRTSFLDTTFTVTPENDLLYRDERGRRVVFARPFNLSASTNPKYRHLSLRAPWLKKLELQNRRLTYFFEQGKDKVYRLYRIEDRDNNSLAIERDTAGMIVRTVHSDGYSLSFTNTARGLRLAVTLEAPDGQNLPLARYTYDSADNLIHADCETAFSIRYRYDDTNRLIAWQDTSGRSETKFFYDMHDRVSHTETTGPWHRDAFEYDHVNRITTYRPGGGEAFERFHYDADDNVLRQENALGEVKSFDYEDGYRTSVIDGDGNRNAYSYDLFGNIASHTDAEGRITLYRWGTSGELDLVIDHAGNAYTNELDERGHVLATKDPNGNVTRFGWDDAGRLTNICFPDGSEEHRSYDQYHRLIAVTAPNGATSQMTRDTFGRIKSVTNALGAVTRYFYDPAKGKSLHAPTRVERPDGVSITRSFDLEGQVVSTTDGEGRTTCYQHGPWDQLVAITDPKGGKLQFSYDFKGNLASVTNARGDVHSYERDLAGRIIGEVDFDGRRVGYRRDKTGRVVARIAPDGTERRFAYDRTGRVIRVAAHSISDNGIVNEQPDAVEAFTYDERGLISGASNKQTQISFERDPSGRIIAENQDHRRVVSRFDTMGRRIERTIGFAPGWSAEGKAPTGFQGLTVDDYAAGQIVNPPRVDPPEMPQPDSVTHYVHDPLGLLSELLINVGPNNVPSERLAFERNAMGWETKRSNLRGFSLQQIFDPLGQLQSQKVRGQIEPALGQVTTRDASRQVDKRVSASTRHEFDSSIRPSVYERRFNYDKTYTPISIGDDLWGETDYSYDLNGQVTEAVHSQWRDDAASGAGFRLLAAAPTFEPLGLGEETSESERFSYDEAQNIAASATTLSGEPASPSLTTWLSQSNGAVKVARGQAGERIILTHDPCGRVIVRRIERKGFRPSVWRYTWDGFGRLVGCKTPDDACWTYVYDPFGRRVEKRLVRSALLSQIERPHQRPNIGTRFIWDGDTITEEIPLSPDGNLDMQRRIAWHYEPGTFRPLVREGWNGSVHHVVTDHLGTPRECISADGRLDWAAHYRLWGAIRQVWRCDGPPVQLAANGSSVISAFSTEQDPQEDLCPIRFQGQWEDEESGLYYNRFRFYDPLTASYLSLDPIGLVGGIRPGGYVRKPLTMTDPYGLEEGARPPFYTFPNNAGGNVSVSTIPITQSDFSGIVDNAKGPINILTGTHGDELGNFGRGPYAEPDFFNEDLARWGQSPNVKVLDVTKMSPEEIHKMVNSPDDTVCAWCYSEKAKFVGKIERPAE